MMLEDAVLGRRDAPSGELPRRTLAYALLTDLYQLTMAQGYWANGKLDEEACFHMFFRENPFKGGFAIACGAAQLAEMIDGFRVFRTKTSPILIFGRLRAGVRCLTRGSSRIYARCG